jgi:hypothetical protein
MENLTVKFLEDCDPQDGSPIFKAGSVHTINMASALFWLNRGKAERCEIEADKPRAKDTKTAQVETPAPDKQKKNAPTVVMAESVGADGGFLGEKKGDLTAKAAAAQKDFESRVIAGDEELLKDQ